LTDFTATLNSSGVYSDGGGPTDYTVSIAFTLSLSIDLDGYLHGVGTASGTISGTNYLAGYPGVVLSTFNDQLIQPAVDSPDEGGDLFDQNATYTFDFGNSTGVATAFELVQFVGQFNADDTAIVGHWIVDDENFGMVTIAGTLSGGAVTLPSLFTTGGDVVDFNNLEAGQVLAIANGADLYHGLGGADFVDLPNVANYGAIGWNSSATFYTGSLAGDSYFVTAGDGNYNIQLGAGSDSVMIDGDGDSVITAGYGAGDISSTGTGTNTIDLQPAPGGGDVVLTGPGDVQTADGLLTQIVLGDGLQLGNGLGSSAEINDPGSNAGVAANGGEVILDQPTDFKGLVGFLAGTDSIDLKGVTFAGQPLLVSAGSGLDSQGHGPDMLLEVPVTVGGVTQLLFLNLSANGVAQTAAGDLALSFSARSDGAGGVLITDKATQDPPPTALELAELSGDAYNPSPTNLPTLGFTLDNGLSTTISRLIGGGTVSLSNGVLTDGALQVVVYSNPDQSQIVIAVRGTDTSGPVNAVSNLLTDLGTFPTGSPTPDMQELVSDTAHVLRYVASLHPGATITLTGHSLGGAAAEIVSKASGYSAVVFNAPGGATIYPTLAVEGALTAAEGIASAPASGTTQVNYRDIGDAVSLVGAPIGLTATIVPISVGYSDSTLSFLQNHYDTTVINNLQQPAWNAFETGTQLLNGVYEPNAVLGSLVPSIVAATSLVGSGFDLLFQKYGFTFAGSLAPILLDPGAGTEAYFTLASGSPALTSITFLADPAVDHYLVWSQANGTWSAPQSVTAGEAATFGAGVDDVRWEGVSAAGVAVPFGSASVFEATFASTAQVNASLTVESGAAAARDDFKADGLSDLLIENTVGAVVVGEVVGGAAVYTGVSGLGPEWSFHGTGDYLGDGKTDFLIENTVGAVVVGEVVGGQTNYTQVAGLGPEWSFREVGDFLGDGQSDFLIENTVGAVVIGEVVGGAARYTLVSGLGPEWKFVGAGDFLGEGHDQFLIENTNGAVVVGDVIGGQAVYTQVAGLGSEWKFEGAGDFLGDGKSDFLIENTAGAVVVGEVVSGEAQYTQLTALGPEWKFVAVGDYLGEGHDQFLIENTAGVVDVADWTGGAIHFTQVTGLGAEWAFH
jgi:hypothetical protein